MSDRADAASLGYLERLLRTAVTERRATDNPVAGRVIVSLLAMAMTHGGAELIAEFVAPQPGEAASYSVLRFDRNDRGPTVLSADLNAVTALRAAIRFGRDGVGGINLVGRAPTGVERRALIRPTNGVLEYRFPSPNLYTGPPEAVLGALRLWDETLRRWGIDLGRSSVDPARSTPSSLQPPRAFDQIPTAAEIANAIQSSLMQLTVDINLSEVESLIRRTIEDTFGTLQGRPLGAYTSGPPSGAADIDLQALAERVGGLVFERIRPLITRGDDGNAEAVAGRVVDELRPLLAANPPSAPPAEPAGDEVRRLLATLSHNQQELGAAVDRHTGLASRVLGAIEHLDLQVREVRENTRLWSATLMSLIDQVAGLARRMEALGERLATAVGRELDQFSDRVKHQMTNLEVAAKWGTTDKQLTDAVSRLTSRLAHTDAQVEQLLGRLNELEPPAPHQPPTR